MIYVLEGFHWFCMVLFSIQAEGGPGFSTFILPGMDWRYELLSGINSRLMAQVSLGNAL